MNRDGYMGGWCYNHINQLKCPPFLTTQEQLSTASWGSAWRWCLQVDHTSLRFRRSLRHGQGRHRHQQHLHLEARRGHEVSHPRRDGRYIGHLRHDRGSHSQPAQYNFPHAVKNTTDYSLKNGFSHMASGLVCGFSCVVLQV